MRLGVSRGQAREWAGTRKAHWRVAGSGILDRALDCSRLRGLGWTFFFDRYVQVR